jgi:hypothetical protein
MTAPRLHDAVTLRHFGCIESMSILESRIADRPHPLWTFAVREEIWAGMGRHDCDVVLSVSFLGTPYEVPVKDLPDVYRLQIALSSGRQPAGSQHLGEAEGIYVADKLNGEFVTDDNAAHDLAVKRLGPARVLDTVDLLRECVRHSEMTDSDAQHVADAIRNSGRSLRRAHPLTFPANYFA